MSSRRSMIETPSSRPKSISQTADAPSADGTPLRPSRSDIRFRRLRRATARMPASRATSVSCSRSVARRRHVEQQLRVPPDRREVQVDQLVARSSPSHLRPRGRTSPDGSTRRSRPDARPSRSDRRSAASAMIRGPSRPGYGTASGFDRRPVRVAGDAALVADPADVRAGVGEHHRVRLQPPDECPEARPVVDLLAAIRALRRSRRRTRPRRSARSASAAR